MATRFTILRHEIINCRGEISSALYWLKYDSKKPIVKRGKLAVISDIVANVSDETFFALKTSQTPWALIGFSSWWLSTNYRYSMPL